MANFEHVDTSWVRKAFYIEYLWWVLLKLIHFLSLRHATLLKETPTKVCSCENCEDFKNIYLSRKSANNCFCSSCFLLLIFFLRAFLLLLIQYLSSLQGPLYGLKSSPQGAQWQTPLLFEKKKNQPKWPLAVIRCHSLSLDVPLVCLFINDPLKT